MYSSTVTITFLALCGLSLCCNALQCYQCGSEAIFIDYDANNPPSKSRLAKLEDTAIALESCTNLESSYSAWPLYAVECPPEEICVKTIIDDGFDADGNHHYFTASRGCAMRNTSTGKVHPLGCGILKTSMVPPLETIPSRWDLQCFCNTDFCNGSKSRFSYSTSVLNAVAVILVMWR